MDVARFRRARAAGAAVRPRSAAAAAPAVDPAQLVAAPPPAPQTKEQRVAAARARGAQRAAELRAAVKKAPSGGYRKAVLKVKGVVRKKRGGTGP